MHALIPQKNVSSVSKKKSSRFGGKSSNSTMNVSEKQTIDAVELVKIALAALQKGDGNLGRERLEQALSVWR